MLVLSRKAGEQILIGGDVVVTILETRGGRVRVGVTAPKTTPVHREEVQARVLSQVEFSEFSESGGRTPK
jgi:carbon storage regulator